LRVREYTPLNHKVNLTQLYRVKRFSV
jgi:hypothetical protein